MNQYFIFGAGGHAKVVIDALLSQGEGAIQLYDDDTRKFNIDFLGYKVQGSRQDLIDQAKLDSSIKVVVAIGADNTRRKIYEDLKMQKVHFSNIIHRSAIIANFVELGEGLMIMAGAIINADTKVGNNVIINTGSVIEHDVIIGDHVHIAPNATLCGGVRIGELTLIGAGAIILPGIKVGSGCLIGAGSVVTNDVQDRTKLWGAPARIQGDRDV